ncbi:MAG: hypothetical protein P1P82_10420 [Bacteroidales bacterium]|nr:hypothetical protein [Bacteroidales bacterium]MDT8430970.1 hypothetical protein [Bacteroidales bacterium]
MKHLLIVVIFIGMKSICAFAGIYQAENAVLDRMDTIIPVPDFSMSGYAAMPVSRDVCIPDSL